MGLRWVYNEPRHNGCLEQLLHRRGLERDIFTTGFDRLPDPAGMKDVDKAANRIIQAVRNKERIVIFGDDDIDGITSTYILFNFLELIGSQHHYFHIPNRLIEVHGIQPEFIEKARQEKYDLIITVDGGVSCFDAVEEINRLGMEIIITDHHLIPERLPNAAAVVNPKQEDCDYGYSMLAGVGVAYMLIRHLGKLLQVEVPPAYLLWTAIGTVADKAPLDGVNRIMVKHALENWQEYEDETLALFRSKQSFTSDMPGKMAFLSYIIRILSGGRDERGEHLGLKIMLPTTTHKQELLDSLLVQKKNYENQLKEMLSYIAEMAKTDPVTHFIHFDQADRIPYTFMGVVANYVAYKYRVPTIILKRKGDYLVCEGRCTDGFNLVEAFEYCAQTLVQYGGHVRAAGFSMEPAKLDDFLRLFVEFVNKNLPGIAENRRLCIDIVLDEPEIPRNCLEELDLLQPFGMSNPEPMIMLRRADPLALDTQFYVQNRPDFQEGSFYDVVFTYKADRVIMVTDWRTCP